MCLWLWPSTRTTHHAGTRATAGACQGSSGLGSPPPEDRNVPFFVHTPSGKEIRTFIRHPENARRRTQVKELYTSLVRQNGLQACLRAPNASIRRVAMLPTGTEQHAGPWLS